ncbi:glycosyl-4,4'-diaponeurosporenoate acyltransferase [Metabacillus sp. KIGAM252]|uniref:Glycosyl-4,4'-diaponeurosporenoate acyltransferase n=1 Tax=Metabacillus flavus TaxID=2823519 RepID=A0ABS5LDB1_9BACI|nr:glycosyl-4,4'-diaponeurosporenoate acyltransferase [Metabacillus flavus]MBS2968601.1 glycosyl-4,4'-diaponeurosporenoate acyltransferase [Metabacillus flavus]
MSPFLLIAVNAILLLFIQFGTAWILSCISSKNFRRSSFLYKKRKWERDGRFYERLAIKWWKDRLPEAGGWFKKGYSKKSLRSGNEENLDLFILETRRGELAHWLQILPSFLFFLWNSPYGGWIIVIYSFAFNLPFIAIQRYNRIRLIRASETKKRIHRKFS